MKVKKYVKETRPLSLAQKLQAYKEASLGLTQQQGKTAFAVAASSLAALTPFVAQAQCGTGSVTLTLPKTFVFFDLNGDGTNDLKFKASGGTTTFYAINGARLYVGAGGYATKFALNATINNTDISNLNNFQDSNLTNYLCFPGLGTGNFCTTGAGYLGIKFSNGKLGFIKITRNSAANYTIDRTLSGLSTNVPAANSTQVKAGNCASLSAVMPVELTARSCWIPNHPCAAIDRWACRVLAQGSRVLDRAALRLSVDKGDSRSTAHTARRRANTHHWQCRVARC